MAPRRSAAHAGHPTIAGAWHAKQVRRGRITLAKRAGQRCGWQAIEYTTYGKTTTQWCKTFLRPIRRDGGVIRVVLVERDRGWHAFCCTEITATVSNILEAFSDRATIEQDFHDVKEAWATGQQQPRSSRTNLAAYHLILWMHTLVALWALKKQKMSRAIGPTHPGVTGAAALGMRAIARILRQHIM